MFEIWHLIQTEELFIVHKIIKLAVANKDNFNAELKMQKEVVSIKKRLGFPFYISKVTEILIWKGYYFRRSFPVLYHIR